eukprot:SAG31_NODE_20200_length_581_cov_0.910788_1_plen_91_part_00
MLLILATRTKLFSLVNLDLLAGFDFEHAAGAAPPVGSDNDGGQPTGLAGPVWMASGVGARGAARGAYNGNGQGLNAAQMRKAARPTGGRG